MNIARSTFYHRCKAPPHMTDTDVTDRIEAICLEFPGYGYRRVTKQLQHEGKVINHKKVLRLMRESDLLCRVKRKWVKTTDSKHPFFRYPNLIKGMLVSRLNQVWLADITYPSAEGHPERLCLPGSHSRCLFPPDRWLRHLDQSGNLAHARGASYGHRPPPTHPRHYPPLGPGCAIRFGGICG